MFKSKYAFIATAILFVFVTACAGTVPAVAPQATSAPAQATAAPEATTAPAAVNLKILDFAQENVDFYKDAVAEFHKEYPNITVQWDTMVQDDYTANLPLMFKSNTAPDIFIYYAQRGTYFETSELLDYGWAQPFDPKALAPDFRERFAGAFNLIEPIYGQDGKVYAVPFDPANGPLGHGYMWYNQDVLKKAGVEAPKTWDELLTACRVIRKTGAYCLGIPLKEPSEASRTLIPMLSVNGADQEFRNRETGLYDYTSPAVTETMQFLRKLYEEDLVVPGINDKGFIRAAIAHGDAGIYLDGGWMANVFASSYDYKNPGVAVPPAPDAKGYRGKIKRGPDEAAYFISATSQHPFEATEFINWMTDPNGWFTKEYLTRTTNILPWADNEKLTHSDLTKKMVELSPQVRDWGPVAALKCPDLAKSQASADAVSDHPNWEWEVISEYLLNGGDWVQLAKPIEDTRNKIFTEKIKQEEASGLKVSADCYAAPGWNPLTPFDYAQYKTK